MDENSDAVHAGNSNGNGHGVHSSNGADVTQSTKRPAPVQVSLHPVSINPALLYPQYTLPSIKALPAEYARRSKGKDRKRRDKDKDKDKGEKERDKERERQKDAVVANISNSLTLPTTALTTTPAGNSTAAEDVKPSKDKDEKPTIDTGVGAGASNGSVVKRDERKDEFEPLGLNRWGAMLRANPVHRALAHSTKALSSKDWNVSSFCRFGYVMALALVPLKHAIHKKWTRNASGTRGKHKADTMTHRLRRPRSASSVCLSGSKS
jgi:hypothetical protein